MAIDSHMHFWTLTRNDYHWLTPEMDALYRDYHPEDIITTLEKEHIRGAVLIQAAATVEETRYLLSLADQYSFILGVVGWIDFDSADKEIQLQSLLFHPKLKGIRPMIQDIPDKEWILGKNVQHGLQLLEKNHLSFDALVKPEHLENLIHVLEKHPDLNTVIDHGAKPDIRSGNTSEWKKNIQILANNTQAVCKCSGLLTEAQEYATLDDLRPYLDWLVECFGMERLMFGSDWPVINTHSTYSHWLKMLKDYTASFSVEANNAFWEENAQHVYNTKSCF